MYLKTDKIKLRKKTNTRIKIVGQILQGCSPIIQWDITKKKKKLSSILQNKTGKIIIHHIML